MGLAALFQAAAALLSPPPAPSPLPDLSAREKAALVVVSGLPAPRGVAGVIVREYDRHAPRPRRALVFVDQEGGIASAFDDLPPALPASAYASRRDAFQAGRATGRALRRARVHVDLAPVLDSAGGPLGSRHFRAPVFARAFARGLGKGGVGACVKHFPGLGTARVSTDESPHVQARLRRRELAAFKAAVRDGVPCVMVSHAYYRGRGPARASFEPKIYRLLRRTGFEGVAITDSVSVFGSKWAVFAARHAIRAGADLVLYTNGPDARRAIRALVPWARRGLLDERVARVLELRHALGVAHDVARLAAFDARGCRPRADPSGSVYPCSAGRRSPGPPRGENRSRGRRRSGDRPARGGNRVRGVRRQSCRRRHCGRNGCRRPDRR